jgi:hypothetical protein
METELPTPEREEIELLTLDELREALKQYGVSKLARKTGYSRQHVQSIAGGHVEPSPHFLEAIGYRAITFYEPAGPIRRLSRRDATT